MKTLIYLTSIFLLMTTNTAIIFDFNTSTDLDTWRVVDDVVMGGHSSGNFSMDKAGNGVFEGVVSLENNGGFSSIRHITKGVLVKDFTKVYIKLKGDGKSYQFRIKADREDYYSFITSFTTSGEWETVEIPLKTLYPAFRGQLLRMPNFNDDHFEQIGFLIANKKNENFKLVVDEIGLK